MGKDNIIHQTSLEELIESCSYFRLEIQQFVESKQFSHSTQKQWIQERINIINDNLASHRFHLSIAGDFVDYNIRLGQYPSLQLQLDSFLVYYHWGPFFNRFLLSSFTHDILQIEPNIKLFYPLDIENYLIIKNNFDIVTAELTQHQINEN